MTTFNDMVFQLGGVPVSGMGEVALAGGQWYFCDPNNGTANGDAKTPQTATNDLKVAYNLTRDGYNDGVIFIAGPNAYNPATMVTWAHSYCHLIGTNGIPGLGNRSRVVAAAAAMTTPVFTLSGNGCLIKNMQFGNEYATGSATGVVEVTGLRNLLENVFFMVPFSATAASYSLKITGGEENVFRNCTIGQMTCARGAATHGLWIIQSNVGNQNPTRNRFLHCEFLSWLQTAGHAHITIASDVDIESFTLFLEDCLFLNINGGADVAHAIIDGATNTHHRIILRGNCMFDGNGAGMASPVTYVYSGCPLPVTPTTAVVAAN